MASRALYDVVKTFSIPLGLVVKITTIDMTFKGDLYWRLIKGIPSASLENMEIIYIYNIVKSDKSCEWKGYWYRPLKTLIMYVCLLLLTLHNMDMRKSQYRHLKTLEDWLSYKIPRKTIYDHHPFFVTGLQKVNMSYFMLLSGTYIHITPPLLTSAW